MENLQGYPREEDKQKICDELAIALIELNEKFKHEGFLSIADVNDKLQTIFGLNSHEMPWQNMMGWTYNGKDMMVECFRSDN